MDNKITCAWTHWRAIGLRYAQGHRRTSVQSDDWHLIWQLSSWIRCDPLSVTKQLPTSRTARNKVCRKGAHTWYSVSS